MTTAKTNQSPVLVDIWGSFRSLPVWVQVWAGLFLAPLNIASLFFLDQPMGVLIAVLAYAGMLPNIPIMIVERGVSRLMSVPHLLPWTALVALLVFVRPPATGAYAAYLWVLLAGNVVSLVFDYIDSVRWLKGDRAVAGR